jgi:serine/threonine-protein kinase
VYNLLTGEIPTESILRATKSLVKPSEINKEITPETEAVILTAMQVNPIHRYQSVQTMMNELDIPSDFEDTPNLLTENTDFHTENNEEVTGLLQESNSLQQVDSEQTEVRQNEIASQFIRKKKRKKRTLIPVMIFVFAFLGYGVAYLFELNGSRGATQHIAGIDGLIEPALDDKKDEVESNAAGETILESQPVESVKPETVARPLPENRNTPSENTDNMPDPEMIDAEYALLMASGAAKLEQNDFAGAEEDLNKAKDLKPTIEILNLLRDLEAKAEEEKILARKALYREMEAFGNLTIVRKLSDNRFGAIDNTGEGRIPCTYVSIARPSDRSRRAFEREDHTYDIFNVNGERVGIAQISY